MITILSGNLLEVLDALPELQETVHCLVTSPPYWMQRLYPDAPDVSWPEILWTPMTGLSVVRTSPQTCQLGREQDPLSYIAHMVHVFRKLRETLRQGATCWVNLGDTYIHKTGQAKAADFPGIPPIKNLCGIPQRFALAMQADGWFWRNEIIWQKTSAPPSPRKDALTVSHEQILFFTMSSQYHFDIEAIREPLSHATIERDRYSRITSKGFNRIDHSTAAVSTMARIDQARAHILLKEAQACQSSTEEEMLEIVNSSGEQTAVRHDHETPSNLAGRQKRTVWSLPVGRSQGRHFAVFSPELARPCIRAGSSEWGCCAACGVPYRRLVERPKHPDGLLPPKRNERHQDPEVAAQGFDRSRLTNSAYAQWLAENPPRTIGWRKGCPCETDEVVKALVLDPFSGEGNSGVAAAEEGRDYIGIDADRASCAVAYNRLKPFATPLFDESVSLRTLDDLRRLQESSNH